MQQKKRKSTVSQSDEFKVSKRIVTGWKETIQEVVVSSPISITFKHPEDVKPDSIDDVIEFIKFNDDMYHYGSSKIPVPVCIYPNLSSLASMDWWAANRSIGKKFGHGIEKFCYENADRINQNETRYLRPYIQCAIDTSALTADGIFEYALSHFMDRLDLHSLDGFTDIFDNNINWRNGEYHDAKQKSLSQNTYEMKINVKIVTLLMINGLKGDFPLEDIPEFKRNTTDVQCRIAALITNALFDKFRIERIVSLFCDSIWGLQSVYVSNFVPPSLYASAVLAPRKFGDKRKSLLNETRAYDYEGNFIDAWKEIGGMLMEHLQTFMEIEIQDDGTGDVIILNRTVTSDLLPQIILSYVRYCW